MRKIILLLSCFVFFFIFLFLVKPSIAAACDLVTSPSPLRAGSISSISFNNFPPDSGKYYLAFESSPTGNCPYDATKPGVEKWGCVSNSINTFEDSITFSGSSLGGLTNLQPGTYSLKLLSETSIGSSIVYAVTCQKDGTVVQTSSGDDPGEDPEGPGQNQQCEITNNEENQKCQDKPILRFQGTCAQGFYCDCKDASGYTCEQLICADGSNNCYGTVPDEAKPTIECTKENASVKCLSGYCDTETGQCSKGYAAYSCVKRNSGEYVCKTAIGRINTSPDNFVRILLRLLLGLSGGILLVLMILNGYKYMTSQGDPEKVKDARDGIIAALAGILLIIFSLSILQLITVDILGLPGFSR